MPNDCLGATTICESPDTTQPLGNPLTPTCSIDTSLPRLLTHAVGNPPVSESSQTPLCSILIFGAAPTRTGISSIIVPEPSESDILSLKTPTSPATASLGGVTNIVTVAIWPGSITSPLLGISTIHPWPAFVNQGASGELPICCTFSVIFCPSGSTSRDV